MRSQTNVTNRAICFSSIGFSAVAVWTRAIFHSYMVTVLLQVFPGAILHGSRGNIVCFQSCSDVKCWQRLADILLLAEVIQCCLSGGRWWNNFTLLAFPFSLQFLIHHHIHKVHFINDFVLTKSVLHVCSFIPILTLSWNILSSKILLQRDSLHRGTEILKTSLSCFYPSSQ